jgi:uncharacterized protein (TIGR02246 family)
MLALSKKGHGPDGKPGRFPEMEKNLYPPARQPEPAARQWQWCHWLGGDVRKQASFPSGSNKVEKTMNNHSETDRIAREFLARLAAAWDAGDARAYAACFTREASYVTWLGELLQGREQIDSVHDEVFTRWASGKKMRVEHISATETGPDCWVVLTVGGIGNGPDITLDKFQTLVLLREGGSVGCVAFHNSAMSDDMKAAYGNPH